MSVAVSNIVEVSVNKIALWIVSIDYLTAEWAIISSNVQSCVIWSNVNDICYTCDPFFESNKLFLLSIRKHSSRMRTARLLTVTCSIQCVLGSGGSPFWGFCIQGILHRWRSASRGGVSVYRGVGQTPLVILASQSPILWTEWQMFVKILPCPLRAVIIITYLMFHNQTVITYEINHFENPTKHNVNT